MKFEKFFKKVGTHGIIVKHNNESWLLCNGTGMRIPDGVNNIGVSCAPTDDFLAIVDDYVDRRPMILTDARLMDPAGNAKAIIRKFSDGIRSIEIHNEDYGLLEKSDRLSCFVFEDENGEDHEYIIVRDYDDDIVGFIAAYEGAE